MFGKNIQMKINHLFHVFCKLVRVLIHQLLEGFAFNEIKRNGPLTFKYTDFQYLWYVNSAGFFYTRGNQRFI